MIFFKFLKLSQFDLKFIFQVQFFATACKFYKLYAKTFFWCFKNALDNWNTNFGDYFETFGPWESKYRIFKTYFPSSFKWHKRLHKLIFFDKHKKHGSRSLKQAYKYLIWTKTYTNRENWFWAKYGDFQNMGNVKKNEVFQLQVVVSKKVAGSRKWKICQKIRIELYFLAHVTKSLYKFRSCFYSKIWVSPHTHKCYFWRIYL